MSEPTVVVRLEDGPSGPVTLRELHDMSQRGEITRDTPMWSERWQEWTTVSEAPWEMRPEDKPSVRLEEMRESGVYMVDVLGTGDDRDCPACRALHGRTFQIDVAPQLPPVDCRCEPWCRCIYGAREVAKDPKSAPGRSVPGEPPPLTAGQWKVVGLVIAAVAILTTVTFAVRVANGDWARQRAEESAKAAKQAEAQSKGDEAWTAMRMKAQESGRADARVMAAARLRPTASEIRAMAAKRGGEYGLPANDITVRTWLVEYESAFKSTFKRETSW
jgi:hypothetical protein